MKFINYCIILSLVLIFGCKQSNQNSTINKIKFEYESSKISKKVGCLNDEDTSKCIQIELNYPVAKKGEPNLVNTFNIIVDSIMTNIVRSFNEDSDTLSAQKTTLNAEIDKFIANYDDFTNSIEDKIYMRWELEADLSVVFENDSILTLNSNVYSFTGGAHPNTNLQIITIEKATGKILSCKDFFIDNKQTTNWLEGKFRIEKSLGKEVDLEQEGYFLKDGAFFLPENIGFEKDSILFYYNDYEIASHAEGPTALKIPLNEVLSQLNPQIKSKIKQ